MKHKLFAILLTALGLMSELVAQGPDDFPDAPTQGAPITALPGLLLPAGCCLHGRSVTSIKNRLTS